MGYEIRILSDEEFDRLPYPNVEDSLGLADTNREVAFVRQTGVKDMDDATISHEFDELMMETSEHEIDGIRYKSGGSLGKIFAPIVGAVLTPFVGPLGATIAGAMLSAGTGAHTRSVKPEKYGSNTFGSIFTDAATGGLSAYGGGQLAQGAISGFKAADPGFLSKAAGTIKGAVGIGSAAPQSASIPTPAGYSGTVTIPGQQAAVPFSSLASGAASAAPAASTTGANLLDKFGSYGTNLATNQAVGALSASNQSQASLYPTERTPASNVSPIDLAGTEGALSRFAPETASSSNINPVSQEEYDLGVNRLRQNKQTRISDLFRTPAFRGQTPEENTALARQLEAINQGSVAELEQYNKEINTTNANREYDAVLQANKLTTAQMNEYIDLAQKSDAEIAARVANTPAEFRAIFAHLPKRT